MGLFDGLDVASAQDNPFDVAPGTYPAVVTKAEARPTKGGDKVGLNIEYTISDPDSEMHGRKVTEWKQIPQASGELTGKDAQAASFLKQRLMNLGIPESRMNDIEGDDLIGIECVISVKKNGEYTNVTKVALQGEDENDGSARVPTFA